jgi:hypothetical protein
MSSLEFYSIQYDVFSSKLESSVFFVKNTILFLHRNARFVYMKYESEKNIHPSNDICGLVNFINLNFFQLFIIAILNAERGGGTGFA